MIFLDYYKILGLDRKATSKDIRDSYRRLARKYHPDLNPNDKDAKRKFQEINEANEVLSEPEKRKKYDQYGKDWKQSDEFEKAKQYSDQSSKYTQHGYSGIHNDENFSDFFESMFGKSDDERRNHQVKYRGEDYNAELHLDLIDAIITHKQTLTINKKKIRLTIPAGIENGQTIKISGHGGPGKNGGPNGDLFITFSLADHPAFKRLGTDLFSTAEIDLYTAVLGGEITIDTLTGKAKLRIKPGTQNGWKIKLKGKGFPAYKEEGKFGDLYVSLTIKIPSDLTEKQKELFTVLAENKF